MSKKINTIADIFKFNLCDGAKRTLAIIKKEGKLAELKNILNEEFSSLTSAQMDGILYYDRGWIYGKLGMDTYEKETSKINRIMDLIEKDYILGISLVRSINSYNGEFEHMEYLEMDEFDSYTEYINHHEIAQKIFYGKGFNPRDTFFKFDSYENLESVSEWEVKKEIIDNRKEIAEILIRLWGERFFTLWEYEVIEILEEN